MKESNVFTLDELSKARKPGSKDIKPRKKRSFKKFEIGEKVHQKQGGKRVVGTVIDHRNKGYYDVKWSDGSHSLSEHGMKLGRHQGTMKKSEVFTLDELRKANKELKLTKDEAREWINVKIKRMAKDKISSDKSSSDENPMNCIAKHVYECLVSDWQYDNKVLEASRSVGLDESYVLDVIAPLFDSEGNPVKMNSKSEGPEVAKQTMPEEGRPYYASMITLDKAHDDLTKARKAGSKDTKKRKSRAAMRAASKRAYASGYFGPGSKGRMSRYAYKPKKGGE